VSRSATASVPSASVPHGALARSGLFLLLALALVWAPVLLRCSVEWSVNAQYYYGWAVPFLAAYLAWERLAGWPVGRPPAHPWLVVAAIAVLALPQPLLRIVSEANSDWRLVLWAMGGSAAGISFALLYLGGGWPWAARLAFPILFLATAIPWPTFMESALVQGMMRLNAGLSADFVSLCGVPAIAEGNVIQLPTGLLGVNEACSGIRSLQSTLMASIFLGGLYRISPLARVLLVALGVGIAFVLNVVRTVFLSWQGAFHGIEATEKWHDSAGFAILGMVMACLWIISRFLEKRAARKCAQRAENSDPSAKA
jgi:exosortase